jgi:methyl-accepting chemotaxis protein/methyl-accepting chemotaxis protein-1 (serine sensor receptor)
MRKMTIGTKLIGGFSALLLLMLVLAFTAMTTIRSEGKDLDHALAVSVNRTVALGQLRAAVAHMSSAMKGTILFFSIGDTGQLDAHKQEFDAATNSADRALKNLQPLLQDDHSRAVVQELQNSQAAMAQYFQNMLQLCAQQKPTEAIDMLSKQAVPEVQKVERAATELLDLQTAADHQDGQRAESSASVSNWISWGMLALAMALGAGVLYSVIRVSTDLRQLAARLAEGAHQLSGVAGQVSSASQSLAQGASQQAASLEETSASSQEMASMTRKNTENTRAATDLVSDVDHKVQKANDSLNQMVTSMSEINASSNKISKILKVIDEIAFQTNILALNAAVEAARAGEAGMGFAVVADEVRNLAQKCAQAAKDTAVLIDESIAKTNEGAATLDQVATAIHDVTDNERKVKVLVEEVNLSSQEQARGIEQISQAFVQIEQVTQKTAASAEESTVASQELNKQSEAMAEVVLRLRDMVGGNADAADVVDHHPARRAASAPARTHAHVGNRSKYEPVRAGRDAFPLDDSFKEF